MNFKNSLHHDLDITLVLVHTKYKIIKDYLLGLGNKQVQAPIETVEIVESNSALSNNSQRNVPGQ